MKHLSALVIKSAMTVMVLELVLGLLTNLSYISIFYISLAVVAIAYIIGDLIILNKSNNTVATIADIGLSLITIWMFNWIIPFADISFTAALMSSVVIGVGEWFFHKYVNNKVFPSTSRS